MSQIPQNEPVNEEISPLRLKMAELPQRSNFASFFCKTRRVVPKELKADPLEPEHVIVKQEPVIKSEPELDNALKFNVSESVESPKVPVIKAESQQEPVVKEESQQEPVELKEKEVLVKTDPNELTEPEPIIKPDPLRPLRIDELVGAPLDIFVVKTVSASQSTTKNDIILISDSEPLDGSDIEELPCNKRRRSKRTKTTVSDAVECISISSDDSEQQVTPAGNEPTKSIPLSDYSNMKKMEFTKPVVSLVTEKIKSVSLSTLRSRHTGPHEKDSLLATDPKIVPLKSSNLTENKKLQPIDIKKPELAPQIDIKKPELAQPIAVKKPEFVIPESLKNLDPILREELMSRMAQKMANKVKVETKTEDNIVAFTVIQRVNPGSFDASKSQTKFLLPAASFTIYWRSSDTFGAMKRKLALDYRISPFDLVLVKADDNSELFDTTKPSTLNLEGISLQEFAQRQKQSTSNSKNTKAKPVTVTKTMTTQTQTQTHLAPTHPINSQNTPSLPLPNTPDLPPLNTCKLFLYTKVSYALYKAMVQNQKQRIYESLSFLQTAEAEISKFTQESSIENTDEQIPEITTSSTSGSISLNVKTATSRNQSYSIKVSVTATVNQILEILSIEHKIKAFKVIFDGDVLKNDAIVGEILEDDDMIEVK